MSSVANSRELNKTRSATNIMHNFRGSSVVAAGLTEKPQVNPIDFKKLAKDSASSLQQLQPSDRSHMSSVSQLPYQLDSHRQYTH